MQGRSLHRGELAHLEADAEGLHLVTGELLVRLIEALVDITADLDAGSFSGHIRCVRE